MFLLDVFGFVLMGLHVSLGAFTYPYSGVWPLEWPFSVSFALREMSSRTIMTAHEKLTDELQPMQMLAR
jgi:hypothetical protein